MQPNNESSKTQRKRAATRSSRHALTLDTPECTPEYLARVRSVTNFGSRFLSPAIVFGFRRRRSVQDGRGSDGEDSAHTGTVVGSAFPLIPFFPTLSVCLVFRSPASPACTPDPVLAPSLSHVLRSPSPLSFPPKSSIAFSPISTSITRSTQRVRTKQSEPAISATCRSYQRDGKGRRGGGYAERCASGDGIGWRRVYRSGREADCGMWR